MKTLLTLTLMLISFNAQANSILITCSDCISGDPANATARADAEIVKSDVIKSIGYKIRSSESQGNRRARVLPIDGKEPAIEISEARTSLPEEFLDMGKINAITERKRHVGR